MSILAEAYYKQGYDAHAQGHLDVAIESYRKVLALKPDHVNALNNLGNAFQAQGNFTMAVENYRKALGFMPNYPVAHYNLGNALQAQGMLDEAIRSYQAAVSLKPDYVDAHINLGGAFLAQGKLLAAIDSYHKVLSLKPDFAEIHSNLGNVFMEHGDWDAAAQSYHKATSLKPDYVGAHYNLAGALQAQGKLDEAVESLRKALALSPDYADAHNNLGSLLRELGQPEAAAESFRRALALKPGHVMALTNLLYLHAFARDISPESELDLASTWETIALDEYERTAARNWAHAFANPPRAGRKLRVGIVSAELGQHPVAVFLEPLLEKIDRSRFHINLYPTVVRTESRAERFKLLADAYKPLAALSDHAAAEQIRADRIDILLDTTGHMRGCRLGIFAHRAAPVQCHYIGYHGTSGLTEMDWLIADEALLPPALDQHFREKIWRLPRLRLAYRGDASLPDNQWQAATDGTVWLGTFNNLAKVREQALALWARVMKALPESKLLLKDSQPVVRSIQERILAALEHHGISRERVEFAAPTPDWRAHMALYNRLDIALDTLPLNSETTAFDALWMGVPVITLEGGWYGSRMTSAILKALGKPEWIARSEDEYVSLVALLARDRTGRKTLRTSQRSRMAHSPLCDTDGLAKIFGNAFDEMFELWLAKQTAATNPT